MPLIDVKEKDKKRLDNLRIKLVRKRNVPNVSYGDAVAELLDVYEVKA
jgi:hypothetical protein